MSGLLSLSLRSIYLLSIFDLSVFSVYLFLLNASMLNLSLFLCSCHFILFVPFSSFFFFLSDSEDSFLDDRAVEEEVDPSVEIETRAVYTRRLEREKETSLFPHTPSASNHNSSFLVRTDSFFYISSILLLNSISLTPDILSFSSPFSFFLSFSLPLPLSLSREENEEEEDDLNNIQPVPFETSDSQSSISVCVYTAVEREVEDERERQGEILP